jgi:hypothetical protein
MKYFVLLLLLPLAILAQGPGGGYSNNRVVGADGIPGPTCLHCGGSKIDSYTGNSVISEHVNAKILVNNGANISSKDGKLLFYSDGWTLMDANGVIIPGGDTLSPTTYTLNEIAGGGYNFPQSTFIFQTDTDSSIYTILHTSLDNDAFLNGCLKLWQTKIKINEDSSFAILEKNKVILEDTIVSMGVITGCKHANGRDWWIVVKKHNSILNHTFLFTPDSTYHYTIPCVGIDYFNYGTMRVFSPRGNYYAVYGNSIGVKIFNFDRCTGSLTKIADINDPDAGLNNGLGLCFSPEEKYLYFCNFYHLFRIPLQSSLTNNDVELVGTYNNFIDSTVGFTQAFWTIEPSNDGKIYLANIGSNRFYCTIDNPDSDNFGQIGFNYYNFQLPNYNNGTYTNHANYNLGPLSGSPCDTLTLGANEFANFKIETTIFPNPNEGSFTFNYTPQAQSGMLYIYDISGHLIYSEYVAPWSTYKNIKLDYTIPNGMYALNIVFEKKRGMGKFVLKK